MNLRKLTSVLVILFAASLLLFSGTGCTARAKRARHLARADKYFASGDYSRAEVEYLNVLRLDPQNARIIGRLGTIYYEEGLSMRALPFLAKAIQTATNDVDLRVRLATVYLSLGGAEEAREQAILVLNQVPSNSEAPALLAESATNRAQADEVRQRLETIVSQNGDSAPVQIGFGSLSFRQGDLKAAEDAFRRAVSLDPRSSAGHYGLGNILWGQNDLKAADLELKTGAELSPPRSMRRVKYADFKIQTRDLEEGKRLLRELSKTAPDYAPSWIRQAEIALAEKKYDDCASLLSQVVARDSANYEALLLKARLLLASGEPAKAVIQLERLAATGVYGRFPQVHYQLALAHLANTNDTIKALKSVSQAVTLNTNFDDAILLQAQLNIVRGDIASAITSLLGELNRQPRFPQAHLTLATAYLAKGDLDSALATYRKLGELYPKNVETPFRMGLIYLQQNRKEEARQALTKTIELAPNYLPAVEKLIDLDLVDEAYTNAFARVQKEIEKNPNAAEPQLLLAKVHLAKAAGMVNAATKKEKEENLSVPEANGPFSRLPQAQAEMDQAEAALLKALELDHNNHESYLLLAKLYLDTKKNQKALERLNSALLKDPKDTRALMLMATIQEQAKDFAAARSSYEKLLAVNPSFYAALNNLAYLYSEKFGELDKAYDLARKARELLAYKPQPGEDAGPSQERNAVEFMKAFSTDTLGWIVFKRGEFPYALSLLQESSQTLSSEPEVQFHLGMACYMLGLEPRAQAALQRALSFNKDFVGKEEATRRLAILAIEPKTADSKLVANLEKQLRDQPGDPVLLSRLARIYDRDGAAGKTITAYEAALKQNRKNVPVLIKLARLYSSELHDPRRALELAKEAYKLAPDDPEISCTLGRLAFETGDHKWALSLLEQGAGKESQDPELLYDLAMASYSVGRVAEGLATMQNALQMTNPFLRRDEAKKFLELAPFSLNPIGAVAAQNNAREVLTKNPDDAPSLMVVALSAKQGGDSQSARQACEKLTTRFPDFAPASKLLAALYLDAGNNQKAYEMATKARAAFPEDAEVAKTLGIVLYRREDYRNSARLLDESVRKSREDAQALYYLGMAHYQLFKEKKDQSKENKAQLKEQSKVALQQALVLNVASKLADDARRVLAELN